MTYGESKNGRPITEYLLNEDQALFVNLTTILYCVTIKKVELNKSIKDTLWKTNKL